MEPKEILDAIERIELQLKAVWWDTLWWYTFIFFIWLLFIGLAVCSSIAKSIKMALGVGVAFIFLSIILQLAESKELNKVRRKYEKARKEIST